MFTGIIESVGTVLSETRSGTNRTFIISSELSSQLKVDQSVSHEGVCLTVESVNADTHQVTAIEETLRKTNLNSWKAGTRINLERCMKADGRFEGHIVQGHVDATASCARLEDLNGSWEYEFQFPAEFEHLVIEKGSVCVNGTSLTVHSVKGNRFSVSIIPYTHEHTTINKVKAGTTVNIEFDVLGKYLFKFSSAGLLNARDLVSATQMQQSS